MTHDTVGWSQIRGLIVHCHLLYDAQGAYLIDGGFINAPARIETSLKRIDRSWSDLKAILLTHGHLDHTLNIKELQERSGAAVYAPKADEANIAGEYRYHGITRFCGWAEAFGRTLLRFRPPSIDHWFKPNEIIPLWGGLQAIPLPGHTRGHTGFYSPSHRLLFSADLFANFGGPPRLSPPWFTVDSPAAKASLHRAAALDLKGVSPNHSKNARPQDHLRDLCRLRDRHTALH
ncbi:MAG: MBL fold metallo-hydrolase [Verrucomicrobiota bacterium]